MSTPYNLRAGLQRSARAGKQKLKDPGDGGTINATPGDPAVCIVTGGTTRVMADPTGYPVGTQVTVISQTSSITVSTVDPANVALAAGEFATLVVTLNSSGTEIWSEATSSNQVDNAQILPASAGTYEFLVDDTGEPQANDAIAGIRAIVSALDAAGLIDGSGITQATS